MKSKFLINSGMLKGKKILFEHSKKTRPTKNNIRTKIFSYFNKKIKNIYLIDLFSGSGIINFEFISRGSLKNIAIEICKKNYKNILDNKKKIIIKNDLLDIILEDSIKWLKKNNFLNTNIIIYDPPYNFKYNKFYISFMDKIILLRKCLLIFIESKKNNDIINEIKNEWFLIKKNKIGKTNIHIFKMI